MKLPGCCKLEVTDLEHSGKHRPRYFSKVTVKCALHGKEFSRAVLKIAFLYRLRLWLNARGMKACARKYHKFAVRHGL